MTESNSKFHVALHVSDISKTIAFYEALFNTPPIKTKTDYAKFEINNPGLVISFIETPGKVAPGFGHLGLRVESEEILKGRKEEISEKIDIALEEENTNCCYARQNKFWVNDPDGYEWEVYHMVEDVEKNDVHIEATCC